MTRYFRIITGLLVLIFSQNIITAQYLSAKSQELKGPVKSVTTSIGDKSFKLTFTEYYDKIGKLISGHNGTPETVDPKGMFLEVKYDNQGKAIEQKRLIDGKANRIATFSYSGSSVLVSTRNQGDSIATNSTETLDKKSRVIRSVSDNLVRTVKYNKWGLQTEVTMASPSSDYSLSTSTTYKIISKDKNGNWTEIEQTTTEESMGGKRQIEGKRYRIITYWE